MSADSFKILRAHGLHIIKIGFWRHKRSFNVFVKFSYHVNKAFTDFAFPPERFTFHFCATFRAVYNHAHFPFTIRLYALAQRLERTRDSCGATQVSSSACCWQDAHHGIAPLMSFPCFSLSMYFFASSDFCLSVFFIFSPLLCTNFHTDLLAIKV